MPQHIKDSQLDGLKGTVRYCAECGKHQVHYTAHAGWPICHVCGYHANLALVCDEEPSALFCEAATRAVPQPVYWMR